MLCARERVGGDRDERVRAVWQKQHEAAGKQMFGLCVDLKGFYIKASAALPTHQRPRPPPSAFFSSGGCDGTFACFRLCAEARARAERSPASSSE